MSTDLDPTLAAALAVAADQFEVGPLDYRGRVRRVIARRVATACAATVLVVGAMAGVINIVRDNNADVGTSNNGTVPFSNAPSEEPRPGPGPAVADGLAVDVPDGWSLTDTNLSTYMSNPQGLFVLSTGTVDVSARQTPACDAQVPTAVVDATMPAGVFVFVVEQHGQVLGPGELGDQTPAPRPGAISAAEMRDVECGDLAHLYNVYFDDGGRWLGVYVGIGPDASLGDVDLAFEAANSIRPAP
jgi:hypothetical protein